MRKSLFFASLLLFAALSMSAQSAKWVNDPETGYDIPVGACSWDEILSSQLYEEEMETFYKMYEPFMPSVEDMARVCRDIFPEYRLKAIFYFGGWDNDCQELLPAFIRWTDAISVNYNFPVDYKLVAVDRTLLSNNDEFDAAHIQDVPTVKLSMVKKDAGIVVEEVELGQFSGQLQENTLEKELYMIFARYMKYSYGR